jgi:glycosyltransferase involved in cell wall biosynthesis
VCWKAICPCFDFADASMKIVAVPERYRAPVKNIMWHQVVLPKLARRLSLDILHVPSYRRMVWARPCTVVATIHDLAPFHIRGKYDPVRMFYGRVVARALARRQHAVVAISENTARDPSSVFGVREPKLSVVLNGIDHERFHPARHRHRS